MVVGDGGHEAYTAILWGVLLSRESSKVAEAETVSNVEGNTYGTGMRGAVAVVEDRITQERHEAPICDRAVPNFVTSLPRTDEVTAGSRQDAAQLTVERRGHSRRSHHRHRSHAFRDDVHLDLVTRGGEPILCCDLGSDFEHTGEKLLRGRRLGS